MIRKLYVAMDPSEALRALACLCPGVLPRPWPKALGERLRSTIAREFARQRGSLDRLAAALEALERRRLAEVVRPRSRRTESPPVWLCRVHLRVDLEALARAVLAERNPEGRHHTAALALRSVLRHLAGPGLMEATAVRVGATTAELRDALAAVDEALAPCDLPGGRSPRQAKAPEAPPAPAPAPTPPPPAASRPPEPEAAPRAKTPGTKPEREKPAVGFGGLPDDAVPEDRRSGEVVGPNGLTADAELFLTETGIPLWPCDLPTLERARRLVISKLHPDRAGEASTTTFHRAMKGHTELLRKLTATPPVTTPATPVAVPIVTAPVVAAPTSEAPASVDKSGPRRRPRPASVIPAAPPAPPPPVVPSTVCEWPPRAARPVQLVLPMEPAPATPSTPSARSPREASRRGVGRAVSP